MNPIVRNILAVISGIVFGGVVNMAIIMISGSIIPLPDTADITTPEKLAESMHLFQPKHFIMPFLAHALGTFAGAFLAARMAATHKMKFALSIGVLFLIAGISMVYQVPSPTWFAALDLIVAYIPMAYLAGKLSSSKK